MTAIAVDPVEAILALAAADAGIAAVVGDQVAGLHRYGKDAGDWDLDTQALTLTAATGQPQLALESQRLFLDALCWGPTPAEAGDVYRALAGMTRHNGRRPVTVSAGTALVYYVVINSQPVLIYDETIGLYRYEVVLAADVAEATV